MKTFLKLSVCIAITVGYAFFLIRQPFSPAVFILGIPVCNWLANLVHELGHLLAYALLKLKWKRMVVSFFVFEAGRGFRFDGSRRIYEASCTCVYSPQVPLWRYAAALFSGALLGGAAGVGAVFLSLAAQGGSAAFLQCFGAVSILNAAVNLLPFSADQLLLRQIKNERE